RMRKVRKRSAAGQVLQIRELRRAELALQPREAAGERGQRVRVDATLGDVFEDLLEGRRGLAMQSVRGGLVLLTHAHRVDDDEAILHLGAGAYHAQLVG